MSDRTDFLRKLVDTSGVGLEIGPSYNPVFPKKIFNNVKSLDLLSKEKLKAKYAYDDKVNLDNIEDVDFVWHGETYVDLVGEDRFDWIFASHVIEHVPDVISFFNNISKIIKENGSIVLVVPDRRYTFDAYRPQSSLSSIIDTHSLQRNEPSLGMKIENNFFCCTSNEYASRIKKFLIPRKPHGSIKNTLDYINEFEGYMDIHAWVFTPNHFRLLIESLFLANFIEFREKYFHDTVNDEFFIVLSKNASGPGSMDMLFQKSLTEAGSDWQYKQRIITGLRVFIAALDRRFLGNSLRWAFRKIQQTMQVARLGKK